MKKRLFLVLALPALLLAACTSTNNNAGGNGGFDDGFDSGFDDEFGDDGFGDDGFGDDGFGGDDDFGDGGLETETVKVLFYISGANTNPYNPFATVDAPLGGLVPAPTTNPTTNPDSAYTEFVGWSAKPLIMSNEDLWNFAEDKMPTYLPDSQFRLYGQWK